MLKLTTEFYRAQTHSESTMQANYAQPLAKKKSADHDPPGTVVMLHAHGYTTDQIKSNQNYTDLVSDATLLPKHVSCREQNITVTNNILQHNPKS